MALSPGPGCQAGAGAGGNEQPLGHVRRALELLPAWLREGKGMSNSGGSGSHTPGMGSGPWPLCTQALLPLHREGARGFLPQPGRFWRDQSHWGRAGGSRSQGLLERELCLFPRARGAMLGVQGPVLALGPTFTRLGEASTAAGRVGKVVTILFWQKRTR